MTRCAQVFLVGYDAAATDKNRYSNASDTCCVMYNSVAIEFIMYSRAFKFTTVAVEFLQNISRFVHTYFASHDESEVFLRTLSSDAVIVRFFEKKNNYSSKFGISQL